MIASCSCDGLALQVDQVLLHFVLEHLTGLIMIASCSCDGLAPHHRPCHGASIPSSVLIEDASLPACHLHPSVLGLAQHLDSIHTRRQLPAAQLVTLELVAQEAFVAASAENLTVLVRENVVFPVS